MEKIGVLINMSGPLLNNRDYFVGTVNETLKNFGRRARDGSEILSMYEYDPERFGEKMGIDSKYTVRHFREALELNAMSNSYSIDASREGSSLLKKMELPEYRDLGIVLFGREPDEVVGQYKRMGLIPTKYPILTGTGMEDKGQKDYLEKAREMAGSDRQNTMVVTDSVQKLRLARDMGMVPMGIEWGWHNVHHKDMMADGICVAGSHMDIVRKIDSMMGRSEKSI